MPSLIAIPHDIRLPFMRVHRLALAVSVLLMVLSAVLFVTRGLNFGIDFSGGVVIEAKAKTGTVDLGPLREKLNGLGLGEIALQEFGAPDDVLIRVPHQAVGGEAAQQASVTKVRQALGAELEVRRVEVVGPKVGGELIRASIIATLLAVVSIAAYVAFRFEWQFGIGAMLSILHDVGTTIGLFALTQLEFNLATFAAILTIAGYSINDTVVVFDRVRENMRKFKSMPMAELINRSLNETLSRTILTAGSVVLAVLALLMFGGEVIRGLSVAMLWGVLIGTYSSLFIAAPMLLYVKPKRASIAGTAAAQG